MSDADTRMTWRARLQALRGGPTPRDPDPEVDAARERWTNRVIAHRDRHGPQWWGCQPHRVVDVVRYGDRIEAYIVPVDQSDGRPGHVGIDYLEQWEDWTP